MTAPQKHVVDWQRDTYVTDEQAKAMLRASRVAASIHKNGGMAA